MTQSGNIVNFPERSQIEETAARWIVRLDEPGVSDATRAEFDVWRQANPQHQEAFNRLRAHWNDLDLLRGEPVRDGRLPALPRRTVWAGAGIAAALLVGVTLYASSNLLGAPTSASTQIASGIDLYETAVGDLERIVLSDGSVVTLNTASQIEVRFSPSERNIRLLEGEAYFEVESDPGRPFQVYAGKGIAAALGTAFSVRLHDDGIELVVAEGKVSFANVASVVEPIAFVTAGQSATFSDRMHTVQTVDVAEVDRKLAWTAGRLVFNGDPLSSVVADIARYTEVKIEIADPELQSMRVGGLFEVGEVESMLEILETGFGLHVERVNDALIRISGSPS